MYYRLCKGCADCLFNLQVISCPLQASSGAPLVALEAATSPQSLVIVWPANGLYPAEVTGYSVFVNGQPCGEQVKITNINSVVFFVLANVFMCRMNERQKMFDRCFLHLYTFVLTTTTLTRLVSLRHNVGLAFSD